MVYTKFSQMFSKKKKGKGRWWSKIFEKFYKVESLYVHLNLGSLRKKRKIAV